MWPTSQLFLFRDKPGIKLSAPFKSVQFAISNCLVELAMANVLIQLLYFQLLCSISVEAVHNECVTKCEHLDKVPPRWNYENMYIPNVALKCSVKNQCSLDVNELLYNYTKRLTPSIYVSVDIHFNCTAAKKLGK